MASYRHTFPKITWGASFANTLNIGYWLDNVVAGDEPRDGSDTAQAPSGIEDGWDGGTDYTLTAAVRWIPQTDSASPVATGWDGTTGFRAFLAWARKKNQFRFYPDATSGTYITSYLVAPMTGQGTPENDGTRTVELTIRNSSSPYDGY